MSIDAAAVQTNIIYFELVSDKIDVQTFLTRLGEKGIKLLHIGGPRRFRVVTHYGIEAEDIDITLATLREVMEKA